MSILKSIKYIIPVFCGTLLIYNSSYAQTIDSSLFNCMQWRMIGLYRGGRTVGASGSVQQPNVFYIGVNNGGVWKTTDYGRTWQPIFDDQSTGSIGDVAVAPSNPNTIYVGSGEGLHRPDLSVGNGVYKSFDAGKTWLHIGLDSVQQIGGLAIDPKNENRVFAAVLGHPYAANTQRGVYRTIDGGNSWQKVLYIDENTGATEVMIDPSNPDVIYADMWMSQLGPWENSGWQGKNSGLYKSTDGGDTWKELANGLPGAEQGLGRIGFCIAPGNSNRLYAVVSSAKQGGIYRSDDAGESWKKMNDDINLWDRGDDFAEIKADPKNADIVYNVNVVVWKSTDGGITWTGFRGAPGGDDYHRLWINPNEPNTMLLTGDQGAMVTVNGGDTWSSWYNQPTAQLYHVSADNAFPYNVYSGQQESGSVGIASRGNDGEITFRDWHPVGAEEYGYVVADPLNPNIVYGGKISKYDKRTGQTQDISPEAVRSGKYRFIRTAPIAFSPIDNKTLFFAGNVLFKTRDGGNSWEVISPDLTRATYDVPASIGVYRTDSMETMPSRGVIYTIALSPIDSNTIWAGTDDGLIQVTHDGGQNWENVTPPGLTSWSKISLMDASHTDVNTAYAAVNRIRLNDMHPHIYRTKDGGKTWQEIVNGLPDDPINVEKEDPVQKGLLFAGSERMTYVSFDNGDHWQSLRLNMPCTSIRDLTIKDNDLIAATHGRSFWILDDITPLRQLAQNSSWQDVILYKPEAAYRVRWDTYTDTPLPAEEPAGQNPPDGAIIDYYLKENVTGTVTLDIMDSSGNLVHHYSSRDTLYKIPDVNIPLYWIRPQQILSADSGSHRFLWDMHYQPLNIPAGYPIAAVTGNTASNPTSPWVMPGVYIVKLTVNGKNYIQPLIVKMDPRVKTSKTELQIQHDLSFECYQDEQQVLSVLRDINSLQFEIKILIPKSNKKLTVILNNLAKRLTEMTNSPQGSDEKDFNSIKNDILTVFGVLQDADMAPTTQSIRDVQLTLLTFNQLYQKWDSLLNDLKMVNKQLTKANLPQLYIPN